MVKDLFSTQASEYAKFRPAYPHSLVNEIVSLCAMHNLAWDAGTGNGQFAVLLSNYFARVVGTDISAKQIANAALRPNVEYRMTDSTTTDFQDGTVDLVTVAQAEALFVFVRAYTSEKKKQHLCQRNRRG